MLWFRLRHKKNTCFQVRKPKCFRIKCRIWSPETQLEMPKVSWKDLVFDAPEPKMGRLTSRSLENTLLCHRRRGWTLAHRSLHKYPVVSSSHIFKRRFEMRSLDCQPCRLKLRPPHPQQLWTWACGHKLPTFVSCWPAYSSATWHKLYTVVVLRDDMHILSILWNMKSDNVLLIWMAEGSLTQFGSVLQLSFHIC